MEYSTVAVAQYITGKLPTQPAAFSVEDITVPSSLKLVKRLTYSISDASQNHRLSDVQKCYHLLALRPLNERALNLCCHSLECDIISLDLSVRLPFILKFKTLGSALQRGIRFEICYSAGLTAGGSEARRNLISGATALIRATRGRGIIVSSEARSALGVRGPWDVINLATVWGMSQERGRDAIAEESRKVIALAHMKRESFRGVIEFISGEMTDLQPAEQGRAPTNSSQTLKRKTSVDTEEALTSAQNKDPLSQRPAKKRSRKANMKT